MIDLSRYRIVDLSMPIRPGIWKVNGEYLHGDQVRRLEARQFIYEPDKTLMHFVDTETHIGTHVEGPSHHPKGTKSVAELPLEKFIGEALVVDLSHLKPINGERRAVTPSDLEKVKAGDILLIWSSLKCEEAPYLSPEVLKWLKEKGIKMLGLQGIDVGEAGVMEEVLCANDIPVIEGMVNLEKLKRERVFFIGFPIRMIGLDSSWIRAVALEEL